ncbi:hypothetical protein ABZS59_10040 [Streptomyces flaveolus]|uniref:hypothetical protein n=1 Tax=Streptomyces flaveolus TaxID=67297 RepID=UPI00339ED7B3
MQHRIAECDARGLPVGLNGLDMEEMATPVNSTVTCTGRLICAVAVLSVFSPS